MTKLEQLIKKFCPKGVKWISIGSCCDVHTGKGLTKADSSDMGKYPIISGGTMPMGFTDLFNREAGTVTIARAGSAGYVDFITTKFYLNDKCFSIIPIKEYKNKINERFLYFYLKNNEKNIVKLKSEGSVPTVNTQKINKISIPLPPIEVQAEIVKILDKFTSITAELTAELTLRKKQYEFYRDKILTFKREREIMLGEISDMISSMKNVKGKWAEEGNCQFVDYMNAYNNSSIDVNDLPFATVQNLNQETVQQGDILFTSASETPDELAISSVIEQKIQPGIFLDDHLFGVRLKKEYQNKFALNFLKHYFRSNTFRKQIDKIVLGVTRFYFAKPSLLKTRVFMPSLKEQEYIGDTLDKFEKYTTNIQSGLPAEIALRQKQYEYYRNKLLTFKEIRE